MTRTEKARAFDAQNLVAKFNQLYPVGSKVMLRKFASKTFDYKEFTVRKEAFCTNSLDAVAYFDGMSGYFSIDTDFVQYPS